MKKSIISMMLIGMMMLGTGTSFGKSNINNDRHNDKNSPKQEMVMNQNHKSDKKCDCKTCKDIVKKHKVQKKNQCNCKECQKQNKHEVQICKGQIKQHFQTQQNLKVQPQHK